MMGSLTGVSLVDCLGFAASGATLCAFAQRRMMPMRMSAIAANLFFVAYGALGPFYPVLLLHLVLLPLNLKRLVEQAWSVRPGSGKDPRGAQSTLVEEWRRHASCDPAPRPSALWNGRPRRRATVAA